MREDREVSIENFRRVVFPGTTIIGQTPARVWVAIEYEDGKLSLHGVEGPLVSGNARGSAGQIDLKVDTYAAGWTPELVAELREVWKRWHLNDMRAGTQAQEDWIRENRTQVTYPRSQYEQDLDDLTVAGLNPDPGTGYVYGSAWLREEVPTEVLEFLRGLPETTETPAWV